MEFSELNSRIMPPDAGALGAARARWERIAKPLGSLGLLEDAVVQMAGLTGNAEVAVGRRSVLVLCADNGVVREGVAQAEQGVTAEVAGKMAEGKASVCCMARLAKARVIPVDMGMRAAVPGVMDRSVARGSQNMCQGPAMSPAQAERAIETGMELVRERKAAGDQLIATGEMGIGNTTTASAIVSVLCGLPPEQVIGRGAGLSDEGLGRKHDAVRRAISVNTPLPGDALDVLHKLGGFDIAGMAGIFLGGALYRVPVLIDGFISAAAALVALRLCPSCGCAMFATHVSGEPASRTVLDALGKEPLIAAKMRLGEGTGAVAALPLLDMALSVYSDMITFGDLGIPPYEDYRK